MFQKQHNPIAQRNLILYAGLGMLIVAVIHKPSILLFFLSMEKIFFVFLWGFASLFAAMASYEAGSLLLRDNGMPWYARPGGLIVLAVLVTSFFVIRHVMDNVFYPMLGATPNLHERAQLFAFWGMTFLWIVFLERISCK